MRRDQITEKLKEASFEFFFWFSRFECALKECGYLVNEEPGAKAEPDWVKFEKSYTAQYAYSSEAGEIIELHPKRQIVAHGKELEWKEVGLDHCKSDLCKIITMLKTIRNNLFHGGKHPDREMEDIERNIRLLSLGKCVLDQLAKSSNLEGDYFNLY